jgi:hypothetical protein
MTRAKIRCAVALFLVILAAWPALAAVPEGQSRERVESLGVKGGLLSELWSLLIRLLEKEGSGVDPNGAPGVANGGSSVDPSGAPEAEEGSSVDPDGR